MSDVIEAMARALDPVAFSLWDQAQNVGDDNTWRGRVIFARNQARAVVRAAEEAGFRLVETSLVGELVAALRGATPNDRLQYEEDILRRADDWLAAAPKAGGSDA